MATVIASDHDYATKQWLAIYVATHALPLIKCDSYTPLVSP